MTAQILLQYYLLGIPVFLVCRLLHAAWFNAGNLARNPALTIHWLGAETACERAVCSALLWPAGLILAPTLIALTFLFTKIARLYIGATKQR